MKKPAIASGVIIAFIGAITTVLAALIAYQQGREETAITDRQIVLDQQRFDAEIENQYRDFLVITVPNLVSNDEDQRQAHLAILTILYPGKVNQILSAVNVSTDLTETERPEFQEAIDLSVRNQSEPGDWSIVAGADRTIGSAEFESNRAEQLGYVPKIYLRDGWYRTTIDRFPSKTDADRALIAISSRFSEGSFVIQLSSWCQIEDITETAYIKCQ
jgi:hypothetical protein